MFRVRVKIENLYDFDETSIRHNFEVTKVHSGTCKGGHAQLIALFCGRWNMEFNLVLVKPCNVLC